MNRVFSSGESAEAESNLVFPDSDSICEESQLRLPCSSNPECFREGLLAMTSKSHFYVSKIISLNQIVKDINIKCYFMLIPCFFSCLCVLKRQGFTAFDCFFIKKLKNLLKFYVFVRYFISPKLNP